MKIGIYGAGGFAREVAWLLERLGKKPTAYIQDTPRGPLDGLPVMSFTEFAETYADCGTSVAIAIGNPKTREKIAANLTRFETLEDVSVKRSKSVRIGEGSIICADSILTVDIEIGRHVHINLDCTVGHDARIGDFSTLAPGVHVSGNVHIGKRVYIGTGANIINGTSDKPLIIGDDCVIGAGACITTSCESGCLYAGVPATLKKRY